MQVGASQRQRAQFELVGNQFEDDCEHIVAQAEKARPMVLLIASRVGVEVLG